MNKKYYKIFIGAIATCLLSACAGVSQKDDAQIKVATYNVFLAPEKSTANMWNYRASSIARLVRYHDFDVFGTQEGWLHQLDDIADKDGVYKYFGLPREDGKKLGETCAIFYKPAKFELLENGDFWLSETPDKPSKGWNGANVRICTWGKFKEKVSGKEFYFFCTHIDIWEPAKSNGIKMVAERIREIAKGKTFFLVGDFNVEKNQKLIKPFFEIAKSVFDISATQPYGADRTWHGYKNIYGGVIDYIFVSPDVKVNKVGVLSDDLCGRELPKEKIPNKSFERVSYPSDHFPVAADVRF